MREVKFQAWDKWEKEMLPVAGINFTNGFMWINELIDDETPANTRYLDEVVLRQYTGITDKNDVEIYEKDITTNEMYRSEGVAFVVYYDNEKGSFKQRPFMFKNNGRKLRETDLTLMMESVGRKEVIGNIYEDNHLLESEK